MPVPSVILQEFLLTIMTFKNDIHLRDFVRFLVLRSFSDHTRLSVGRSKKKAGDSSFIIGAPRLWNKLPADLREAVSVLSSKRMLKTFLFPDN